MSEGPMPLDFAARRFFPHGGVTKAHMLSAIRAGKLQAEKIGRAYLVTAGHIREWRKSCRVENCRQGSGSAPAKGESPDGSLSMDERRSTLVAALAITQGLRKGSGNTSPPIVKSTRRAATRRGSALQT